MVDSGSHDSLGSSWLERADRDVGVVVFLENLIQELIIELPILHRLFINTVTVHIFLEIDADRVFVHRTV